MGDAAPRALTQHRCSLTTRWLTNTPDWISDSQPLARAFTLAAEAHGSQRRAADRTLFLEHVLEVATLLHDAGLSEELVAAGLLHDSVERGTLTEERLRRAMGERISALVLALTEDESIDSFAERKAALREQVTSMGPDALTIFAADKLSDIHGLRMGIELHGDSIEARMGTTVGGMAGHYRESVELIESGTPECVFIPALRRELDRLAIQAGLPEASSRREISMRP